MNQVKRMAGAAEGGGMGRKINIVAKTENERLIRTSQDYFITWLGARSRRAGRSEGRLDARAGSVGSALPPTVRFPPPLPVSRS